jgi:hypothetical protein
MKELAADDSVFNFCSEFWTLANAALVASIALSVNDASAAMMFSQSILMVNVCNPAVHFVGWHGEDFVSEFAETFSDGIDGEEVGTFIAAD